MTTSTANCQPRLETDIFAMLYIAVCDAQQATSDVRKTTASVGRLTGYAGRQVNRMQQAADLEVSMNAARLQRQDERIGVR